MSERESILTIRHLEDRDTLLSEGIDPGLVEGQEEKAKEVAQRIIESVKEIEAEDVQIFTSDQKRTSETATLIDNNINESNPDLSKITVDTRLRGLDQGKPKLPEGYKDGEEFEALKLAWGPFWEHVRNGDIFYRFGQAEVKDGLIYGELKDKFTQTGECYAEILERHLDFMHSLLTSKDTEQSQKTLNVLIGHSVNVRVLKETVAILKDHKSVLNPMPIGEIPKSAEDNWDKKYLQFGETEAVDLSDLTTGLSTDQIDQELNILRARMVQNGLTINKNIIYGTL